MKFQVIEKTCLYCGKPFQANRTTAKYCGNTCKTYASLQRTGRRAFPAPIEPETPIGERPDPTQALQELNAAIQKNEQQINRIRKQRADLKEEDTQLSNRIRKGEMEAPELEAARQRREKIQALTEALALKHDQTLFYGARLKKARHDLFFPDIMGRKEIKAEDVKKFASYRAKFPFDDALQNLNLRSFGSPPWPFICYLTEHEYSFLLDSLFGIAQELQQVLQPEIVFIIDRQMMNPDFEKSLLESGLNPKTVSLCFADNRADIEAIIEHTKAEFAFLPDISVFKLDYDFMLSLLKKGKDVSIFCASEKPQADFEKSNRLNVLFDSGYDADIGGVFVNQWAGTFRYK